MKSRTERMEEAKRINAEWHRYPVMVEAFAYKMGVTAATSAMLMIELADAGYTVEDIWRAQQ